jgi:beta-RFAP synthase
MNATQNLRNLQAAVRTENETMLQSVSSVTISCTARLHLGFFDLNFALGRRFGSLGLSLDQPHTRLVMRRASATEVTGPERDRTSRYLAAMCEHLAVGDHHTVEMHEAIPAHSGLGSGTQLALAVATAMRRLHGFPADLRRDAERLGRGARSGIGIGLFQTGGLVVDGGRGFVSTPPPILAHTKFPADWRVLLVMDPDRHGLSGHQERAAFDALAPMSDFVSGEICRLVLMQVLPALHEHDFRAFGAAITAIQRHVGNHFAPSQGGPFTSPLVAGAMEVLAAAGATGIGQTSWGPTGFAFANSASEARRMVCLLQATPAAKGLDLRICRALNRGAVVKVVR